MHMLFSPYPTSARLRLPLQRLISMTARVGLWGLMAVAMPTYAQLGGPRLNLPTLLSLPHLPVEPRLPVLEALNPAISTIPLQQLRLTTVRNLLRQHPDLLEADPNGEPIRRAELVLLSPAPGLVDAALALGFTLLRAQTLPELDLHQVVLRPPSGQTTARALTVLRALRSEVEADFNHIYTESGEMGTDSPLANTSTTGRVRVGLIDGGLDAQHPALQHSELHIWGCRGAPVPSVHGTAVASLLVGAQGTKSMAPEAVLYAADIYCGQPAGGAADDVAAALAWMAHEHVAVVNISLVGPANRLLERSVQALTRKGHVVVAAVGNDGPAAPPLYPASYSGVVGVTGVTRAQRVLPEAAQGPQVMFAAPGAQISAAQMGGGYHTVRGTSFAAPRVAVLLAQQIRQPDVAVAQGALARLAAAALDLGSPGRDPVYGLGLVGADTP